MKKLLTKLREPYINSQIILILTSLYLAFAIATYWRSKDGFFSLLIFIIWIIRKDIKENFIKLLKNKIVIIYSLILFLFYSSLIWSSNYKPMFNKRAFCSDEDQCLKLCVGRHVNLE